MKRIAGAAWLALLAVPLAGCGAGDEYAMARKDVYVALARIAYEPSPQAPWGTTDFSVHGNGFNSLRFGADPDAPGFGCTVRLTELAPEKTKIAVECTRELAGVAVDGMLHNMLRNNLIEAIDSTLKGRPFDESRANATAAGWPGDGVDGSIGHAVGEAVRMDAEMRRDRREMDAEAEEARREREVQPASGQGIDPGGVDN